jgi:hypothetical protein
LKPDVLDRDEEQREAHQDPTDDERGPFPEGWGGGVDEVEEKIPSQAAVEKRGDAETEYHPQEVKDHVTKPRGLLVKVEVGVVSEAV